MAAPLTSRAASDTSQTKRPAIDSGVTHLDASAAGIAARLAGVSITLGRTALAVMPESFTSRATVFTRATKAAFETLYAAKFAIGSMAARAPTATIRPFPAFSIRSEEHTSG